MMYYEIYRKRKTAELWTDFKYFKTAKGVSERDKEKKKLMKQGWRVRTRKTKYAEPPRTKYIKR